MVVEPIEMKSLRGKYSYEEHRQQLDEELSNMRKIMNNQHAALADQLSKLRMDA